MVPFCPCAVSGIPEGDPVFDVEFNAAVAETSVGAYQRHQR